MFLQPEFPLSTFTMCNIKLYKYWYPLHQIAIITTKIPFKLDNWNGLSSNKTLLLGSRTLKSVGEKVLTCKINYINICNIIMLTSGWLIYVNIQYHNVDMLHNYANTRDDYVVINAGMIRVISYQTKTQLFYNKNFYYKR